MIRKTLLKIPTFSSILKSSLGQASLRSFSSASTPLTRETFISPDYVKIATAKPTMFVKSPSGVEEVPVPANVRETGDIPRGYSVDFVLDPSRLIKLLAKQNITTLEQIPTSTLEELRAAINAPQNLNIIPTSIYEMKQAIEAQADPEVDEEPRA